LVLLLLSLNLKRVPILSDYRPSFVIAPSATDQFRCVWCNPESLYGGDSDKLTGGGK